MLPNNMKVVKSAKPRWLQLLQAYYKVLSTVAYGADRCSSLLMMLRSHVFVACTLHFA